jgi:hypothetical protein
MKKNIQKITVLLLACVVFAPVLSHAALIKTIPSDPQIGVDDQVRVNVVLDTQKKSLNAISGTLVFDPAHVAIDALYSGESFVSLWIEQPHVVSDGIISFAGMMPGGIESSDAALFQIVATMKKEGEVVFAVKDARSYENTADTATVVTRGTETRILVSGEKTQSENKYALVDTLPPESFTLTRTRDENLFDGKWFLVFTTEDKGSGVAGYRVCESLVRACVDGSSPYELKKQKVFFVTRVHAFDTVGNIRTAFLFSPLAKIVVILCSIFLFSYILMKYVILQRRKKKSTA